MSRLKHFSFILLTVLTAFAAASVSFAKTREVGPGIVIVPPEQELFQTINQAREAKDCSPLVWDDALAKVAQTRVQEIAVSYGHTRPDGSTPQTAYTEASLYFSSAGENLAKELEEAEDVYKKWNKQRASRDNLLRAEFSSAAIAYYDRTNEDGTVTRFWVMEFMKPKPAPVNAETAPAGTPQEGALPAEDPAAAPEASASGEDIPDTDTAVH